MENKRFGNLGEYAKESAHKEYVYSRLPENIRQIGETNGSLKIYIEDYVMTYIHLIFIAFYQVLLDTSFVNPQIF